MSSTAHGTRAAELRRIAAENRNLRPPASRLAVLVLRLSGELAPAV